MSDSRVEYVDLTRVFLGAIFRNIPSIHFSRNDESSVYLLHGFSNKVYNKCLRFTAPD